MTFKIFRELYSEALEYKNLDLYIMERGWQDWMDDLSSTDVITSVLKKIYYLANAKNKWAALSEEFRSLKAVANLFGIPYPTLLKWNAGQSAPSDYLLMLITYTVINDICEKKEEE